MASLKKRIEGEIESALSELGGGPVKTAAVCETILTRWGVDKESFGATKSGKLLWTREYPKAFAAMRKKGLIHAPQWGQVALGAGEAEETPPKEEEAVEEAPTPTIDLEGIDPELRAKAVARAIREAEEHPSPVDEGEGFLDPPAPVEDGGDDFTEEDEGRLAELTDKSEEDISDLFDDEEEEEPQAERVPLPEKRVSFKGRDYLFYAMSEDGYVTLSGDALEGAVTVKLSQGDIEDELEGVQAKLYQAVLKDEDNFLKALAHRSTALGFDSPMGCFGSEEERDECAKCFMDIWCKSHETFRAS